MRINKTDLKQHGYDADCPQCRHMQLHSKAKSGVFRTKPCRDSIVKAISETPEGRARVEAHEERRTQELAERVEWNIRNQEPTAPEVASGFLESVPQPRNEGDKRGLGPQRDLRADEHAVHERPAQVVQPRADSPR